MAAFIKTADHLTVVFDNGESITVYPSNPKYREIVVALTAKDYAKVRTLSSPVAAIKDKIAVVNKRVGSQVEFKNGQVYYNGVVIHNTLTDRIVDMSNDGFDIGPMIKFLENLKQNPSFRAVKELYGFLEKGNLPITEDGHFIAYKRVRNDFTDVHSGKFSNAPGKIVEMPRNEVDEDSRNECSNGLHFCSRDYLQHFPGDRIVVLKINPADVVAIPADYQSTKGRTCRYEVLNELGSEAEKLEGAFRPSADYVEPPDTGDSFESLYDENYDDDYEDDADDTLFSTEGSIETQFIERADGSLVLGLAGEVVGESIRSIDLETGEIVGTYPSLKEAAEDNGVTPSAIRRVLKGERKSTGGYGWSVVEVTPKSANDSTPHAANLATQHEHGTLKSGQPHFDSSSWPYDEEDDEDEDRPW